MLLVTDHSPLSLWKAADISWLRLSRKQGSARAEVGALPTLPPASAWSVATGEGCRAVAECVGGQSRRGLRLGRPINLNINERKFLCDRYPLQSQLLYRKSYKQSSHSHPTLREVKPRVPPIATLWSKPQLKSSRAQKVFAHGHQTRLITEGAGALSRTTTFALRARAASQFPRVAEAD